MSQTQTQTQPAAVSPYDPEAIRPFTFGVSDEELSDLRRRVDATRWPDRETDPSQGVRLATIQALARYWATDYDWRRFEQRFAALPHFVTEIDGVDIPVGVTVFPDELYPAPRSWAEKAYPKLVHYNRVDAGGHFAAWEQPEVLSQELRATFRSLR